MPSHSMFQRRHYTTVANVLKTTSDQGQRQLFTSEDIRRLTLAFCEIFTVDNPRFDRVRFLQACGGREE